MSSSLGHMRSGRGHHMVPVLYNKLVVVGQSDCLLPPFSGLRTRLNETQGREQTFEGEQYREVISQARLSER